MKHWLSGRGGCRCGRHRVAEGIFCRCTLCSACLSQVARSACSIVAAQHAHSDENFCASLSAKKTQVPVRTTQQGTNCDRGSALGPRRATFQFSTSSGVAWRRSGVSLPIAVAFEAPSPHSRPEFVGKKVKKKEQRSFTTLCTSLCWRPTIARKSFSVWCVQRAADISRGPLLHTRKP